MQLEFFDVPSPCIGVCVSNVKGYCVGCHRTRDERKDWTYLSSENKQKVIKRCVQRIKRSFNKSIDLDSTFAKAESASFAISKKTQSEIKNLFSDHDDNSLTDELEDISSNTMTALLWIMKNIFLPIFLSCIASLIVDSVKEANDNLNKVKSKDELKSKIRKLNKDYLSDYRAIKASALNIREDKSKKSNIVGILELGSVVEILDDSNNSWIQIMTTDDDKLIGWVYRRYTLPLKK